MKHYPDLEQSTPEWSLARAGRPCSSEFHKIITPTGKPSKQAEAYGYRLLAELMIKEPILTFESTYWIDRGKTLEPDAAGLYDLTHDVKTERAGFCTDDNGWYGCSPDRLVGEEGLLEIKCPAPQTHMEYLVNGKVDTDYYPQLQGQLFVTGRKWVDIWSYHPKMPPVRIRTERDEVYIAFLATELDKLRTFMNDHIQNLANQGLWDLELQEAA